jgi:hypothetical protein
MRCIELVIHSLNGIGDCYTHGLKKIVWNSGMLVVPQKNALQMSGTLAWRHTRDLPIYLLYQIFSKP